MIYLLIGTEDYLINQEIKKIKIENKIDPLNIVEYDLETTNLEDIIEDAQTLSLFSEKKLIIINNVYPLTPTTKKNLPPQNIEALDNYLKNQNQDTILILIPNTPKLDERKKIVKKIKENSIVKDFSQPNNLPSIVKTMFETYQISTTSINTLIERVGTNLYHLHNEIEKIKTYKGEDHNITTQNIIDLTTQTIDLDIFGFIEHIIKKDKKEAITIYHEMRKTNEEPIKIVIMLANQFRLMYQAKELLKKGHTETDIASILNVHPYRVKLAITNAKNYSSDVLLKFLNDLATMDYQIKNGTLDKNLALELFILKL